MEASGWGSVPASLALGQDMTFREKGPLSLLGSFFIAPPIKWGPNFFFSKCLGFNPEAHTCQASVSWSHISSPSQG